MRPLNGKALFIWALALYAMGVALFGTWVNLQGLLGSPSVAWDAVFWSVAFGLAYAVSGIGLILRKHWARRLWIGLMIPLGIFCTIHGLGWGSAPVKGLGVLILGAFVSAVGVIFLLFGNPYR